MFSWPSSVSGSAYMFQNWNGELLGVTLKSGSGG